MHNCNIRWDIANIMKYFRLFLLLLVSALILTSCCTTSKVELTDTNIKSIERFCGSAWTSADSIIIWDRGLQLGELPLYIEFEKCFIDRHNNELLASGYVYDRQTHEPLIGHIILGEMDSLENKYVINDYKSIRTDNYGHFQLNEKINEKSVLICRVIGYTATMYLINRIIQ